MGRLPQAFFATIYASLVAGCGAPSATPQPNLAVWTPPPDWVTVSNIEASIQVTLPPYFRVGDNYGSIFANEPPPGPGAEIPMQLWAQGPIIDDGPRLGEDLLGWIERRLDNPAKGVPTVRNVTLTVGPAVRYERVDSAGTPNAWRFLVFAIETPRGPAWLMIDGPEDSWPARVADLERIAGLFRIR